MRSSTSSSSDRLVSGHWGSTWLVAIVLVASVLGGWEVYWRGQGFAPRIRDDAELWGLARREVSTGESSVVALVGGSRMQLGVNSSLLSQRLGRPVVQLSINGTDPLPVLLDLAEDSNFRGAVVFGVNPLVMFDSRGEIAHRAYEWISQFRTAEVAPSARIEQLLSLNLHSRSVIRLPHLNPYFVYEKVSRGGWPTPPYLCMTSDRSVRADYAMFARRQPDAYLRNLTTQLSFYRDDLHPGSAAFVRQAVLAAEGAVERIMAKGGRVLFLRLPSGGETRRAEVLRVPRSQYWDVLARSTRASAVHAEDVPELSGFAFPDGSHLNGPARDRFTEALAVVLAGWR